MRMRWALRVARIREKRNAYRVLVGKAGGKRPIRKCKDNIKMDLRELGWGGVDWIHLTRDSDQLRRTMKLRFPQNIVKFLRI
jgi:hypothetical protein